MGAFLANENFIRKFKLHLELESNHRILFSGPYGIGKSSFIRKFFEKNAKYNVVHLYPVNYSISTNEDIVDLLKYDIIYEIISRFPIKLEKAKHSKKEVLKGFVKSKAPEIIIPFIEAIPHFGKPFVKLSKALANIDDEYQRFKKNFDKGEADYLTSLYEKVEKNSGTPYQQDFYNHFIEQKLKNIQSTPDVQNVLIIDDLDRVDPEHIFRLFNVFSAHLELNKDAGINKFGFDKVIFVCDLENIQKIFEHKYGKGVDFSGYIDKFYSHEVFQFDNRAVLNSWLTENEISIEKFNDGYDSHFIACILLLFIKTKIINFRNIESFQRKENTAKLFAFNNSRNSDDFSYCYLPVHIAILSMICGDIGSLIAKMEQCNKILKETKQSPHPWSDGLTIDYIERFLLPVFHFRAHQFRQAEHQISYQEFTGIAGVVGQPSIIKYKLSRPSGFYSVEIEDPNKRHQIYVFWHLLISSTKILNDLGIVI